MSTKNFELTADTIARFHEIGQEAAKYINEAHAAGSTVLVNGRAVIGVYGNPPAQQWGNGSVSVDVVGRRVRTTGTVWAKFGGVLVVEVSA